MIPLVLYGAGSQVHALKETIDRAHYYIAAILNDAAPDSGVHMPGRVVVGREKIAEWLRDPIPNLHYAVSIGNHHGAVRAERHRYLRDHGLLPAHLQHHTALVTPDAIIGSACQLLAFSFVGAKTLLGDAVILNTKASVDHECLLEDGVHVGPGATIAGRVIVGRNTFVGAGAVICPDLKIGSDCVIGAGAVVTTSLPCSGTYVGVPARLIHRSQ